MYNVFFNYCLLLHYMDNYILVLVNLLMHWKHDSMQLE